MAKQFCPRGHDTFIVGRRGNNYRCKACKREDDRNTHTERYRADPKYRERIRGRNNAYVRNRYMTDPEYRERKRELTNAYARKRYWSDPVYRESKSNGWQNPQRALRQYKRALGARIESKAERIEELERELDTLLGRDTP